MNFSGSIGPADEVPEPDEIAVDEYEHKCARGGFSWRWLPTSRGVISISPSCPWCGWRAEVLYSGGDQ